MNRERIHDDKGGDHVFTYMAELINKPPIGSFGINRQGLGKIIRARKSDEISKHELSNELIELENLRRKIWTVFSVYPIPDLLIVRWTLLLRSKIRAMKYWSLFVGTLVQALQWASALVAILIAVEKNRPIGPLIVMSLTAILIVGLLIWVRAAFEERAEWYEFLSLQLEAIQKTHLLASAHGEN
ncbi:MAG: hypothetical protein JWN23_2363 [Rhodocyclales bacterium]|nr:hypothetical protein [Rhodocyclales bacterium]